MPHFEGYGIVTLEGCAFLGGATTFCLKPSEGEHAERCASERRPAAPAAPAFWRVFPKNFGFLRYFWKKWKSPLSAN